MDLGLSHLRQRTSSLKHTINTLSQQIAANRRRLTSLPDYIEKLNQRIALLEMQEEKTSQSLRSLFESGLFQSIEVETSEDTESRVLRVVTMPIECERSSDGCVFDLGRIKMVIDLMTGDVEFTGLDNKHPLLAHPHVEESGQACFGNAGAMLHDLWEKEELASYIGVLMNFLRHANSDDDWGRRISQWPMIKDRWGMQLNPPIYEDDCYDEDD